MIALIKLFFALLTETAYEFKVICLENLVNRLPENDLKLKLLKYQITSAFLHEISYVETIINISECEEDLLEMKNHYQSNLIHVQNGKKLMTDDEFREVYIEQWEYLLEMINERIAEFA